MAVTITLYNHTARMMANNEVDITTFRVMLVGSGYSFSASETAIDTALAQEVSGNGWTAGGETLSNPAITTVTTNDAKLDADDISVTASGGSIGPATGAVLYADNSPDRPPLAYIDFGGSETAGVGTDFNITWNASGIFTWTYT